MTLQNERSPYTAGSFTILKKRPQFPVSFDHTDIICGGPCSTNSPFSFLTRFVGSSGL
jgi:hypothetical protein